MRQFHREVTEFVAHAAEVSCLSISPRSQKVLATAGNEGKINIWNISDPSAASNVWTLSSGGSSAGASGRPVTECLCFDGDEQCVVSGSSNGSVKVFDLNEGKLARNLKGHQVNVSSLHYHPHGEIIASGSADATMKVWDARQKSCIQTYSAHTTRLNCVRFSPDGRWVASSANDGQILLWDLNAGKLLQKVRTPQSAHTTQFEFNPAEFLMAAVTSSKAVRLFDLEQMEWLGMCGGGGAGESFAAGLAFCGPDFDKLVVAAPAAVRLWQCEPPRLLGQADGPGLDGPCSVMMCPTNNSNAQPGRDMMGSLIMATHSSNFVSVVRLNLDMDTHSANNPNQQTQPHIQANGNARGSGSGSAGRAGGRHDGARQSPIAQAQPQRLPEYFEDPGEKREVKEPPNARAFIAAARAEAKAMGHASAYPSAQVYTPSSNSNSGVGGISSGSSSSSSGSSSSSSSSSSGSSIDELSAKGTPDAKAYDPGRYQLPPALYGSPPPAAPRVRDSNLSDIMRQKQPDEYENLVLSNAVGSTHEHERAAEDKGQPSASLASSLEHRGAKEAMAAAEAELTRAFAGAQLRCSQEGKPAEAKEASAGIGTSVSASASLCTSTTTSTTDSFGPTEEQRALDAIALAAAASGNSAAALGRCRLTLRTLRLLWTAGDVDGCCQHLGILVDSAASGVAASGGEGLGLGLTYPPRPGARMAEGVAGGAGGIGGRAGAGTGAGAGGLREGAVAAAAAAAVLERTQRALVEKSELGAEMSEAMVAALFLDTVRLEAGGSSLDIRVAGQLLLLLEKMLGIGRGTGVPRLAATALRKILALCEAFGDVLRAASVTARAQRAAAAAAGNGNAANVHAQAQVERSTRGSTPPRGRGGMPARGLVSPSSVTMAEEERASRCSAALDALMRVRSRVDPLRHHYRRRPELLELLDRAGSLLDSIL